MIHVYFADSYEELQKQLIKNLENDLIGLDLSKENNFPQMFKQLPVICGNYQIQEYLANQLAEKFEIVPGVEFFTLNSWLAKYFQTPLSSDESQKALAWQIWWALECLNDSSLKPLQNTFKKRAGKSSDRLLGFIQNCNDKALMSFSIKLRRLFSTYATYRLDWLFNWLNPKLNKIEDPKNEAFLERHPDWGWQKELWNVLTSPTNSEKKKLIYKFDHQPVEIFPETTKKYEESIHGCLQKLNDDFNKLGEEHFHFFIPLSLPPMFFRYIETFGSKDTSLTFDIYILLPTLALWSNETNKSKSNKKQKEPAKLNPYIDSMSLPSQHIIEQVRALNLPSKDICLLVKEFNNSEKDTKTGKTNKKLKSTSASYLEQLQNAILANDQKLLPTKPLEDDESFKVFKAPSFKRELDAITDWIHFCFNQNKAEGKRENLKLSDFLIVVPDVNEKVTAIESEMESLPKDMVLRYKVLDKNLALSNSAIEAIISLGKLLGSPFRKKDFIDWLELPINRIRWRLSLENVKTISAWLEAAGFHKGISTEQLESSGLKGEDYSLESAIERLTFGYFIEQSNEKRGWGDVLPISADRENGWKRTTDDQGSLLKKLVELAEYFKLARVEIEKFKEGARVEKWIELIDSWLKKFFDVSRPPLELIIFKKKLQETLKAAKEGLGEQECKVPYAAIWRYLESAIESSIEVEPPFGAISFASAGAMIGIPFKGIVFAGLNEPSGFPKKMQYPEYNLMGIEEAKRISDPNSFETDKECFIRLLLNAKQNLIVSYSIGYNPLKEIEPSSVIKNLRSFFLSNAYDNRKQINNKEEIWESVNENVPLNVFSENNFTNTKVLKRSHRKYALEALQGSLNKEDEERGDLIFNSGFNLGDINPNYKVSETINANDLIEFITDPEKFVLKFLQIKREEEFPEEIFNWLPKTDPLNSKNDFTLIFENYLSGINRDELKHIKALDPKEGIREIREIGEDSVHGEVLAAMTFLEKKLPEWKQMSEKETRPKKSVNFTELANNLFLAITVIEAQLDKTIKLIEARNHLTRIKNFIEVTQRANNYETLIERLKSMINLKEYCGPKSEPITFLAECAKSTSIPLEKKLREKIEEFVEENSDYYRLQKLIEELKVPTKPNITKAYIDALKNLLANKLLTQKNSSLVEETKKFFKPLIIYYVVNKSNTKTKTKKNHAIEALKNYSADKITFEEFVKQYESLFTTMKSLPLEWNIKNSIITIYSHTSGVISKEAAKESFADLISYLESPIDLDPWIKHLEGLDKRINDILNQKHLPSFLPIFNEISTEIKNFIDTNYILQRAMGAIEVLRKNFQPPLKLNEAFNAYELYISKADPNKKQNKTLTLPLSSELARSTGFKEIRDEFEEPVFNDTHQRIISPGKTSKDRQKALLRHLIWHAKGHTDIQNFLYHPVNKVKEANELYLDHLSTAKTQELVELLVELYSIGINYGMPFSPSNYKNPSIQYKTLWRGRNAESLKFYTRNFKYWLNDFSSSRLYGRNFARLRTKIIELLRQLAKI